MTMEKDSLKKCAEALDINPSTAFYMRHKLMCYFESEAESTRLGNDVQLDEKFLNTSHKSCSVDEMDHGKQFVLETTDFNQKMTTDFNQYKCHRIQPISKMQ